MEPYIADLINNKKIPKIIRYIIVIIISGFIINIGIECGLHSKLLIGNILGYLVSFIFLLIGLYLLYKIHKN